MARPKVFKVNRKTSFSDGAVIKDSVLLEYDFNEVDIELADVEEVIAAIRKAAALPVPKV